VYFRERGRSVQCLRSKWDSNQKKSIQQLVFTFPKAIDDIAGIEAMLINRLSPIEKEVLEEYLSCDRKIVSEAIESVDLCSIAVGKISFDKKANVQGLKKSLKKLTNKLERVGL
jgi:hypothetical protein